jgi:hypothetical protein
MKRTNLVLDARVLSLCVFTDQHCVHVVVWGLEALDRHAWPDVREQIERAAQRQVQ